MAAMATTDRSERDVPHETLSGIPIEPYYGPEQANTDPERDLGRPGQYPFTRGVYETMHRGRLWTMRMFAGFGTAVQTNERFRYLLEHGQTGLSTAFDMPTLMGWDSDQPRAEGEVGREGVAIDTLADMEDLFAGIPLEQVTTSMTINAPAAMLLAMYICVAEKQGVAPEALGGTIQTDILKEFIAQKEWIFPPEPSMRLVTDMVEFCTARMPRWHPISISGYHIREAGATAAQELAFTLADGFTYVEWAIERGLDVDAFAPRLSFFFNAHLDFFEEIAKYRAARRIWARELRERYGARNERSLLMRFHAQTAGVSLTAQQPEVNLIRTAVEALAAVLGGCQSLHTNSFDEALALPTEHASKLALRTQQVLANEVGITSTPDPLGGSYYVEALTNRLEQEAYAYFDRIRELGGVIAAIDAGFFQREIADAAFRYQEAVDSGERVVVGVNRYVEEDEQPLEILKVDPALEEVQVERLQAVKARRDAAEVERTLAALRVAAEGRDNLMPALIDCSRAYVSVGEMCDVLRGVFGLYRETPFF
jgi:methylmalonyl-CoA mutase N-terminal domain/subunit